MRENGYYWVRFEEEWEVAYYKHPSWHSIGTDGWANDDCMQEIDEERIIRYESRPNDIVRPSKNDDKLFGLL